VSTIPIKASLVDRKEIMAKVPRELKRFRKMLRKVYRLVWGRKKRKNEK